MRLLEIKLTNFRCFESLDVHFSTDTNVCVFVGDNGAGKSAILDAIALGLAPVAGSFRQKPGVIFRETLDITTMPWESKTLADPRAQLSTKPYSRLFLRACPYDKAIEWDVHSLRDKTDRTNPEVPTFTGTGALYATLESDAYQVASGVEGRVPVCAYYSSDRAVTGVFARERIIEMTFKNAAASRYTRESALRWSLNSGSRFTDAFEWFFAMERDELVIRNEKKSFTYQLPVLETVRRALEKMLPEFADPRITTQPLHFLLSRKNSDGSTINLFAEQLSDGYRTMLALVMDFARRLAQANPQLPDPLATEAILMIDEVDLHLHPDWQQTIVPDLQRTFPNTQFILTTHSPEVLTSIYSESVQILRDGRLQAAPGGIYGAESKRTLERVMKISSRPPYNDRVERLNKLFALITAEQYTDAKALAQSLAEEFEGNEPAVDEALIEIENRQWEKEAGL